MESIRRHHILATAAAGLCICIALTAAKCGSSHQTLTKPSPSKSSVPIVVLPDPATTPPSATPSATPTALPSPVDTVTDLTGTWSGHWQDTSPDSAGGSFVVKWTQKGSNVSGTITVSGTPCLSVGTVTGSISGSKITFGAVQAQRSVNYTGTWSKSSMQGTYSAPKCGNAVGNWKATRN